MRFGYITDDSRCNLTDYMSYLTCPERPNFQNKLFTLLERIVPKEIITFKSFDAVSSSNWSSSNDTLLGALINGLIDTVTYDLVLTTNRAEVLSFATPYLFDKVCFYVKRPQRSTVVDDSFYFLSPFSVNVWVIIAFGITACILLQIKLNGIRSIRTLPHFTVSMFLLELLTATIITIYVSSLRAIFSESGIQEQPFRTVNELAELIRSHQLSLIAPSRTGFMIELVKSSSDYTSLHEALLINPLIDIPTVLNVTGLSGNGKEKACRILLQHPNFVLVEAQVSIFNACRLETMIQLLEICPTNAVSFMGGAAFKRHSKMVEIVSRLVEFQNERIINQSTWNRYVMSLTQNIVQNYAMSQSSIKYVVLAYLVGNIGSVTTLIIERRFSNLRRI